MIDYSFGNIKKKKIHNTLYNVSRSKSLFPRCQACGQFLVAAS